MKQTLYKTAKPKPADDSFMLRIAECDKQFVVTQIRYYFDSNSGIVALQLNPAKIDQCQSEQTIMTGFRETLGRALPNAGMQFGGV